MKQLVFFENIASAHRPLVAWYLARGYRVSVFDFTRQLKSTTWLRKLIGEGQVERIYVHPCSRANGLAIEAAEWFYPTVSSHPLIKSLGAIVGPKEVEPIFKHALVEPVFRYFYVRLFLTRNIEKSGPGRKVTLVPESFCVWDKLLRAWCDNRLEPLKDVDIPFIPRLWSVGAGRCADALRHAPRYLGSGMYLVLARLGRILRRREGEVEALRCTYAYAIESKFQTRFAGARRFDFLLDHRKLTKENTALLVGKFGDGPWTEEAGRAGYHILKRSVYASPKGVLKNPPETIDLGLAAKALLEGIRRVRALEWIHRAASMGLWLLIRETNLLERVRFAHYIYINDYRLVPRWRNVLVRRAGAQSWRVDYANGGGFLYCENGEFAGGSDFGGLDRWWSYENANHLVAPGRHLIDWQRKHRQEVREYHDVGNIWSETVLATEKSIDRNALRQEWFGPLAKGRKIVAWFDTSFVEAPNSPSTFTEAIQWYGDILRLVDWRDDFLMVIKPSKSEAFYIDDGAGQQWSVPRVGRGLMRVWAALRNHPRVCFLEREACPSTVVAASDLTVTFCFSSVSAEALGAGRRAIWYEPGQRWRETLFGGEPMLVAHGYEEMRSLVQKLLYEMSDEEYQAYLQNKVRGLVDGFLDGRGLSRFRALLAGEAAPTADA